MVSWYNLLGERKMEYLFLGLFVVLSIMIVINFAYEFKRVKTRKTKGIVEARINVYVPLMFIITGILFGVLFSFGYVFKFFKGFLLLQYALCLIVPLFCYLISSLLLNSKNIINEDKIIKYNIFSKNTYEIKNITLIKYHTGLLFGWASFYIKDKVAFRLSYRHHDNFRKFELIIKETSNCKVNLSK